MTRRKSATTFVRLLAAIGTAHSNARHWTPVSAAETVAKLDTINVLETLLKSPKMVEEISKIMDDGEASEPRP